MITTNSHDSLTQSRGQRSSAAGRGPGRLPPSIPSVRPEARIRGPRAKIGSRRTATGLSAFNAGGKVAIVLSGESTSW